MINFQYDPATLAMIPKSSSPLDLSPLQKLADDFVKKQKQKHLINAVRGSGMIPNMTDADAAIIGSHPEILGNVYKAAMAKRLDPTQGQPNSFREFQLAQQNPEFGEYLKKNEQGKSGSVFQAPDGQFYGVQWNKSGPPSVHGLATQGGQKLVPSKEIKIVGDEAIHGATGETVRNVAPQIAGGEFAKGQGDARAKFYAAAPKLIAAQGTLESQHALVNDEIKRALPEIQKWGGSGMLNLITRNIPGTPGYKVAQLIGTIKNNIGFDKLQEIRDNSPTGGALGALAVQELFALQNVFGALETAQDVPTIVYNLNRLSTILNGSAVRRRTILDAEMSRHKIDPRGVVIPGTDKNQARLPAAGAPPPMEAPKQETAPPLPVEQRFGPQPAPDKAVQFLIQNPTPEMMRAFDEKYGPGASKKALRRP